MRLLDPNRLGRISMRPPPEKRYINCDTYRYSPAYTRSKRPNIESTGARPTAPCAWCGRTKVCFGYNPRVYGFDLVEDLSCCCWACFHQWMDHRDLVEAELDMWFAYGIQPEVIPGWYLPRDIIDSLGVAARAKLGLPEDP